MATIIFGSGKTYMDGQIPNGGAFVLIAQPGSSLTFEVHPQAQGQGIELENVRMTVSESP